ncbi:unnamed protein product [Closterium sp. Yama58-4]|nr:unnamed protein product [Closterium sp. Yama58-4]
MKNPHEGKGVFAPIVVVAKNVIGQKQFNQLRGKGIALHSQVITEFCKSVGAPAQQRQGLIRLAKKNGEKLSTVSQASSRLSFTHGYYQVSKLSNGYHRALRLALSSTRATFKADIFYGSPISVVLNQLGSLVFPKVLASPSGLDLQRFSFKHNKYKQTVFSSEVLSPACLSALNGLSSFSHHRTMGKGRSNKTSKKAVGTDKEADMSNVPAVPVKDAADKGRTPSSSSSPVVLGPFEDLLDLQTKADLTVGQDGDVAAGVADTAANEEEEVAAEGEADADADAQEDEEASSDQAPDDDGDGYLSDDSDEHLEPASLGSIIALKRFSLTLLVPFNRKPEVKRTAVTVAALLDDWKDQLSPDVLQTTTYQELTTTYFSGTRYGRLQVTFNHVRDANFVWGQVIRHECANGDIVDFTWQHPEDARFLRERLLNPTAKEVVVKGVPADITAELIRHLLVVSKLVKRGRSAFASGFGFHRTVDPVTGLDTDRIRGLFIPHADDEYRWRYFVKDPSTGRRYMLHYPSLTCELCSVILTSTEGAREEWVCVQTVCEKAQGNRFEQAAAHVASARHKGGLKKEGAATRASKYSQKIAAFKKNCVVGAMLSFAVAGCIVAIKINRPWMLWGSKEVSLGASPYTILLGDLNIVADPELDKSSKLGTPAENQRLLQICSRWDLQDAFRSLDPTRKEYTFFSRSAKTGTRIDRALVSHSLLNCVTEAKHRMVPYGLSDHWFAVSVSLKAASADDHGPGLWRLQAPHAGGDGVRNIISAVLDSQANCPDQGLERLVTNLRVSMRAHVAEERKRVKATMVHLELKVEELRWKVMSDPSSQALYEDLIKNEAALKLYQDRNKERLQVPTGLLQELAGETPSGFLSGLVKSRKAKTEIAELTFKGVLRKGASEVLQAASEHFREAYSLSPLSSPVEPWPIEEGKTLQESDRLQLDSEWSEQEVKAALKGLPAGKAPGQDGLPKEIFEGNWELLGPAVMREVRNFESAGVLSESFTTAVTILLHKKRDMDDLGNYRPITLLSFFYKLLAKVLANRIKVVLPRVISSNQFGFLPGRSLADAVSLVADAIDAAEQEDEDWLLLLVDFQKAYDSVSREYLFTTLGNMGFPEKFTRWVKGLHDGAATRVLLNGWIGERVVMAKGVRQGCPLAPYLFLCAVEPLCQEIERRKLGVRKRGVKGSLDYIGYADDTTLVLKGKEQVVVAEKLLGEFAEISGLKVNRDKTTLMPLGKNLRRLQPITSSFKWAEKNASERLLGIWITSGGSPGPAWDKAFEKVSAVLSCWETKHLKTSAWVTIINSYAMPILLFQAQIYAPPYEVWTKHGDPRTGEGPGGAGATSELVMGEGGGLSPRLGHDLRASFGPEVLAGGRHEMESHY